MKLDILTFGARLLDTLDLDPVYVALHRAQLDPVQLKRWLLAYWTFYSVGTASFVADAPDAFSYWERMARAAANEVPAPTGGRWPRGAERRHCRGAAAIKCVLQLQERYSASPESMVDYCVPPAVPCGEVMRRVKEHHLFGNWIAFKVADMTERVLGTSVSFDQAEVFMFDSPAEAAAMLFDQGNPTLAASSREDKILWSLQFLHRQLGRWNAPPRNDRTLGLQEYETILCKWKSHVNGHYPVGKDVAEVRHSLTEWAPHSVTAARLLGAAP